MPEASGTRRRMIRLPVGLDAALVTLAAKRGVTVSALMRLAITEVFFSVDETRKIDNTRQIP